MKHPQLTVGRGPVPRHIQSQSYKEFAKALLILRPVSQKKKRLHKMWIFCKMSILIANQQNLREHFLLEIFRFCGILRPIEKSVVPYAGS